MATKWWEKDIQLNPDGTVREDTKNVPSNLNYGTNSPTTFSSDEQDKLRAIGEMSGSHMKLDESGKVDDLPPPPSELYGLPSSEVDMPWDQRPNTPPPSVTPLPLTPFERDEHIKLYVNAGWPEERAKQMVDAMTKNRPRAENISGTTKDQIGFDPNSVVRDSETISSGGGTTYSGGGGSTTPAPTPAPTQQFYQVGTRLFNAENGEYIDGETWERDWTGRATQVPAPGTEVDSSIFEDSGDTDDLTAQFDSSEKTTYADALTDVTRAGALAGADDALGQPASFDNLLDKRRAVLLMAALEQDLTPDDMKHLTPQQSAAVLSKERGRIDVALAGVNSIIQSRKDRKIEDEERAVKQFEIFVESGVPTDQLPDGFLDNLDAVWGLPKDTHANVYKSRTTEDEQEKFVAELQIQSAILGMVNSTPLGEEFTIGDHTYTGLSIANMMTGTEQDVNGNVTLWQYDPVTGETKTRGLGQIGTKAGWETKVDNNGVVTSVNPTSGEMKIIYDPGDSNIGMPTGGMYDVYEQGVYCGQQCGEWIHNIVDIPLVGDTVRTKHAVMTPGMTADDAQVGDVFMQDIGSTGHIGIINAKWFDKESGEWRFRVSESNRGNDERVTHDYELSASQISGYRDTEVYSHMQWGTDTSTRLDFSEPQADGSRTPQETDDYSIELRGKFLGEIDDFVVMRGHFQKLEAAAATEGAAGALAVVFAYMKMLDPRSIVRENEQLSAQNAASFGTKITNAWNKLVTGDSIDPTQRQEFVDLARTLYETEYNNIKPTIEYYSKQANDAGIDPYNVLGGISIPDVTPESELDNFARHAIDNPNSFVALVSSNLQKSAGVNVSKAHDLAGQVLILYQLGFDTQYITEILNQELASLK